MARKSKSYRFLSRRYLLIALAGVFILAGATLAWRHNSAKKPLSGDTSAGSSNLSPTASGAKVNLNPPSQAQKNDGQTHKAADVQKDQASNNGNSQSSQASVLITEANQSEVRGYVSGILEDGGTCTATAAAAGQPTATGTSQGFKNVSYTQCAPMSWSSNLANGTWTITLSYSSNTATVSTSGVKTFP